MAAVSARQQRSAPSADDAAVGDRLSKIRGWILAVLVLGMVGTIVELVLLAHYDDGAQFIPLALIVVTLVIVAWHRARPGPENVRALQGAMTLFLLAGLVGVILHFQGAAEFQREIDPSQGWWTIFGKVVRAHEPPLLAPGVMLQLGAIGLIYTYRHPMVTITGT
jgi:hypothetical protein